MRDGARGWREKGKSLGGRRAGPAASPNRSSHRAVCSFCASLRLRRVVRRDPRPNRGAQLLPGCRPAIARPQGCAGCGAVSRGWWFGGRSLLSLAEGLAGKEGERGNTHTRRGARALHTSSRAPPARSVQRSLAPRLGPLHLPALSSELGPRPQPADPPAPGPPCSPFAVGNQQHPDNLQTVAQLVSTTEAPECCPSEKPGKENSLNNE